MGPIRRIVQQLDIHPEALRSWVKRAEVDVGRAPAPAAALSAVGGLVGLLWDHRLDVASA